MLGWACEQQGPTSPSALGTPGGSSLGGVTLDGGGGVRLASCKKEPDQPKCNGGGGGGGGGEKTFQAIITIGDSTFPATDLGCQAATERCTVTTVTTFPVDNQCNSGNSVPMNLIIANRMNLTQLALEVKKCRQGAAAVKVWVANDDGTKRFATRYLHGNPSLFLKDSVTFHVHKEDEKFFRLGDTTGNAAFRLNIADIEYTLVR